MNESFAEAIQSFRPELPLAVAFSGGADSMALLWACARRWPGQVGAIHVHHGLQAAADAFAEHCLAFCAAQDIPLQVMRVDARHAQGQSPEEAARGARYAALQRAAEGGVGPLRYASVAVAQHADDQVETMLLALSRGAGLPGLAAMPSRWVRGGVPFYRPLLRVRASAVRAWLDEAGQQAIEDPTNTDEHFTRNRIRVRIMPILDAAFPHFRETFARSARHAAQAQEVLDEVAERDLAAISQPLPATGLLIAPLRDLTAARQANVLRRWMRVRHGVVPRTSQLDQLLLQLAHCSTRGHKIRIRVAGGWAVREGPVLAWYNPPPGP